MTSEERIATLTGKVEVMMRQRNDLMEAVDYRTGNLDKLKVMSLKRARTIAKQTQRDNTRDFKRVRRLNERIEGLEWRLSELKTERQLKDERHD